MGSPFMHLIDPATPGVPGDAGSAYLSWGFRKSFMGVWAPESLRFYSDQKLGGRELHPAMGQDVHRMGGDIFLDGMGTVVLDHYSKTNQDRPLTAATLLPLSRALDAQRRSSRLHAASGSERVACMLLGGSLAASVGSRYRQDATIAVTATLGMALGYALADIVAFAQRCLTPTRSTKMHWEIQALLPQASKPREECKT